MSYKNQRTELGLPPAGSLAPMTTIDGSKWHHGVDGAAMAKLTKISAEINDLVDKTAVTLAKAQINVGRLLLEARELIPGDLQFGQWREKNTSITNKTTANKLMNLAKQIGDGRITQDLLEELPMSTLKELISAPDSVVTHIRQLLREDTPVTRNTVRDAIAESKGPVTIEGESTTMIDDMNALDHDEMVPADEKPAGPAPTKAPTTPQGPRPETVDVRSRVMGIIGMNTMTRLRVLKEYSQTNPYPGCKPLEWAWLVLGLDPDPAHVPNRVCLEHIANGESSTVASADPDDKDVLLKVLTRAEDLIIKEEY